MKVSGWQRVPPCEKKLNRCYCRLGRWSSLGDYDSSRWRLSGLSVVEASMRGALFLQWTASDRQREQKCRTHLLDLIDTLEEWKGQEGNLQTAIQSEYDEVLWACSHHQDAVFPVLCRHSTRPFGESCPSWLARSLMIFLRLCSYSYSDH